MTTVTFPNSLYQLHQPFPPAGDQPEAIEKLTGAGLIVKDVVVLVDRQSGAKESLEQAGFAMHAVLTISQLLDYWEKTGKVEKDKTEETRTFLKQNR